ncbi:MAG: hypothetical protein ACREVO_20585 [Steroidobacteraceae bacterium]
MIAQIWRGVTRAAEREACVAHLLAAIHTALVDPRTCKGAYLLSRPTNDVEVELMVLTLFEGIAVTACHDDEALYRAAVFDRPLPRAFNKSVAVYEVLTEPRRTLSYANLRRRFPLRLMGPR